MKTIIKLLLLMACFSYACNQEAKKQDHASNDSAVKYTCSMHPQIIQDKPGLCPICHMDLVKVSQTHSDELILDQNQIKLANIKTQKTNGGNYQSEKTLNARLIASPEQITIVSARYAGRVDRLYQKEAGLSIQKGAPLYRIYSEELLSLQKEYLLNLQQQKSFPDEAIYARLLEASKNKLALYGLGKQQIASIKSNLSDAYLTVYAPQSGILTEVNIAEGDYVTEGMSTFKLENLDRLWVEADLYASETNQMKIGAPVTISVSGVEYSAKVEFISPQLNSNSQILSIRTSIANKNRELLPGMPATLSLQHQMSGQGITIPTNAVIRDKKGDYIWIKKGDHFKRKKAEILNVNENDVLIQADIEVEEEIVVSGTYLLDSEYILKKSNTNH